MPSSRRACEEARWPGLMSSPSCSRKSSRQTWRRWLERVEAPPCFPSWGMKRKFGKPSLKVGSVAHRRLRRVSHPWDRCCTPSEMILQQPLSKSVSTLMMIVSAPLTASSYCWTILAGVPGGKRTVGLVLGTRSWASTKSAKAAPPAKSWHRGCLASCQLRSPPWVMTRLSKTPCTTLP
jgi:hypothetical protein